MLDSQNQRGLLVTYFIAPTTSEQTSVKDGRVLPNSMPPPRITSIFMVFASKDFLHIRWEDSIHSVAGHFASFNEQLVCQIIAINDYLLITAQLNLIDLQTRNNDNSY